MTHRFAPRSIPALSSLVPLLLLASCADGVPPASPTYAEVAPILAARCAGCHVEGGIAPFALDTFEAVSARATAIKAQTQTRAMPPWGVDSSGACGTYLDARWLSDEELATLAAFADAGAPRGEGAPLTTPPAPERLEGPTYTIEMPAPYLPNAAASDDYRCFIVDPPTSDDMFLTAYSVRPGDARIVHHVLVFALDSDESEAEAMARDAADDGPGYACFGGPDVGGGARTLAGWAPGTAVTRYPAGTGIRLAGGRKAVMQVHYNLGAGAFPDRTAIDLQLAPTVEREAEILPLAATHLELEPGHERVTATAETRVEDQTTYHLLGVFPHMHLLGTALRVERIRQGVTSCVVDVPRWDFHWQQFHFYQQPIDIGPGDSARITCSYDTRGRTDVVTWGEGTEDEMCVAGFYFTRETR